MLAGSESLTLLWVCTIAILMVLLVFFFKSIYSIGPTQVGLVRKRFGKKLPATTQ